MTTWKLLIELNKWCSFHSKERPGKVSNSELRRWCQSKSVIINGKSHNMDDVVEKPIQSFVLFPKHPVTIY